MIIRPASFSLFLFLLNFKWYSVLGTDEKEKTIYKFVEFPYKETTKNEIAYREFESACEQTANCVGLPSGSVKSACVRECISPSCYRRLYAYDPLEEGEIDVRLASFKGCFIQRVSRQRP